jgi:hypothetical protein
MTDCADIKKSTLADEETGESRTIPETILDWVNRFFASALIPAEA